MKKLIFLFIISLLFVNRLEAGPPSRSFTYTSGEVIDPSKVTTNEDNIFNYLSTGVDTIKDGSIVNADIASDANIAASKLDTTVVETDTTQTISGNKTFTGTNTFSTATTTFSGTANMSGTFQIGGSAVNSSATELNTLDGIAATLTATELNTLDGIAATLTSTELNTLDGVPATLTATELGYVDGVTSAIQTQIDTKGTTTATQANDTDAGTAFYNEATFLSVDKTTTSGKTVLLIASGYLTNSTTATNTATIRLKQGSTVVQTVSSDFVTASVSNGWSTCGIVTGLSGSITFSVTGQTTAAAGATGYGNLVVFEF